MTSPTIHLCSEERLTPDLFTTSMIAPCGLRVRYLRSGFAASHWSIGVPFGAFFAFAMMPSALGILHRFLAAPGKMSIYFTLCGIIVVKCLLRKGESHGEHDL